MDDLQSHIAYNRLIHECCLLIVSETWLRLQIPNATGRTIHCFDWTEVSGKSIGGGVCDYVLENWCSDI